MTATDEETMALVRQGDEALAADDVETARTFYLAAFRGANNRRRASVISRIGFLPHPDRHGLLRVAQAIEALDRPPVFVGHGLATWMKSNSFNQQNHFLHLADKHAGLLGLPNWQWNLLTITWAIEQARPIPGDFVELGVFHGHTTAFAAEYVDFASWDRRWLLYDTFEGIPLDQLNAGWEERNELTYRGTYSFEEVKSRFAAYPNIEVIKGRVPDILDEVCPDHIAFMHIDMNSAVAEIAALDHLYDRISPGGVIVFDDFGWFVAAEQHKAERDWMARRGLKILELPTGQGVFVKPPA